MNKLNYNHLFYFYTVIKECGVENAARVLGVEQSVVSAHLRKVKDYPCKQLLKKDGRRLQLTEEGIELMSLLGSVFDNDKKLKSILFNIKPDGQEFIAN